MSVYVISTQSTSQTLVICVKPSMNLVSCWKDSGIIIDVSWISVCVCVCMWGGGNKFLISLWERPISEFEWVGQNWKTKIMHLYQMERENLLPTISTSNLVEIFRIFTSTVCRVFSVSTLSVGAIFRIPASNIC